MTQSNSKPPYLVKPLKRNLHRISRDVTITAAELFEESSTTIVMKKRQVDMNRRVPKSAPVASTSATSMIQNAVPSVQKSNGSKVANQPEATSGYTHDDTSFKTRLRELYLLSAEKLFKDAAVDLMKPYKEMVAEIDKTIPRESKREKLKRRQMKRKSTISDDESKQSQMSTGKSNSQPRTNGFKKIKSIDDIFV